MWSFHLPLRASISRGLGLTGLSLICLQAGCFSFGARGGVTGGKAPSTGAKAGAAAADVVTLPLQVAAMGGLIVHDTLKQGRGSADASPKLVARIKADPELIFREKMLEKSWTSPEQRSIEAALLDPAVPFTESQLRRILPAFKDREHYVVQNPHFSEASLRELFASIQGKTNSLIADGLARNPNTPTDILEAIAADPTRHGDSTAALAQINLKARKTE